MGLSYATIGLFILVAGKNISIFWNRYIYNH